MTESSREYPDLHEHLELLKKKGLLLTIDRVEPVELGSPRTPGFDLLRRNRLVTKLDLKNSEAQACALDLAAGADVLVEGFRPGVMERLGLGYEALAKLNPALVYAAIRGFGDPRSGEIGRAHV